MWTGLVFAGGASTRMGSDKALLVVGGTTLVARAVATVRAAGGDPLVLTPPRPPAAIAGARQLDESDGAGPGGPLPALRRGLAACGPGATAVALACDLPLVPPALLRDLAAQPGTWDAAVPRAGGVLQVMAAAYRGGCLGAIDRALLRGDRSLVGWLDDVDLRVLDEGALASYGGAAVFLNVNAPADRERAETALAARGSGA
ncbi:MAG TPA: molybdenum cofactor guanylyltransferase [Dongiaceae bacterium]|nr:molybdenum cofactor guanylyltransferase [Dongiaceae bacterium]